MKTLRRSILLLSCLFMGAGLVAEDCCRTECKPRSSCDCENISRSYLTVKPHFQSAAPELISGFSYDRLHAYEDGCDGAEQVTFYGSKSTNDRELARYFFPFCKTDLIVEEQGFEPSETSLPTSSQPMDIRASHFNVITDGTFKSKISIRPQQSVFGAGFQLKKAFAMDKENGRGFYTSLSFPVEKVTNDLRFKETIINGPSAASLAGITAFANMTEALQQSDWAFGKITPFSRSKVGVADVEWKVGYEWVRQEQVHLDTYMGIKIPSGNKPTAEYLFEPIVGNGHHWGLMLGNRIGIEIWNNEAAQRSFRVEYAGHTQYLFSNTQCRSIDLFCKQWSRYIEMYRDEQDAMVANSLPEAQRVVFATPGINVLTLPVKVRPGFSHNMTTMAHFRTKCWNLEAGYNLYCRESECVKLACPWQEGPAIKYLSGDGNTNPVRDITGNYRLENLIINEIGDNDEIITTPGVGNRLSLGDYKYNMIKEEDLDLVSASSPYLVSHTVYAALTLDFEACQRPAFVNGGGSYEFNRSNNAGVERWTIWAKAGLSF